MQEFDPRDFVSRRYGARATEPMLLGAGEWSKAYAFLLDGREAVIRFGAESEDVAKDEAMSRFNTAALPIPGVVERGATDPGFFCVSERAHGDYLDDLDEPGMRAVLPALFSAIDGIRAVPVDAAAGYGVWGADGIAPHASWCAALLAVGREPERPRVAGWRAALQSSPRGQAAFDAAFNAVAALAPGMPGARHVVHSDLLNRNVLVDGARVTAVLDWGSSLIGDWLYDVAWLLFWWPWYPAWREIDLRSAFEHHCSAAGALPLELEARLRCYQLHIGLESIGYSALKHRWGDVEWTARRIHSVLSA